MRQLIALMLLLFTVTATASSDHDMARRLLEAGDIVSLELILEQARQRQSGTLLEAELDWERGRLVYELEFLDPNGRVNKMFFDAKSGELLYPKRDH